MRFITTCSNMNNNNYISERNIIHQLNGKTKFVMYTNVNLPFKVKPIWNINREIYFDT